ncbi:GNAT family N-acetyltransferase [Brevundimonas sp.]|uniref:GNAT family N-acetyltransferase n=1 Tax=Brevundimonas sp. TaxID=1871086 RepID=UPI002626B826|nr:GNAT family N-acetyltransferase [Brevundimonas sp.]
MTQRDENEGTIRRCSADDSTDILSIINAAAEAYRGVIPPDRWHEPYMPAGELAAELADGVAFSGYRVKDRLIGVMGVQELHNVDLIRHAYVLPDRQGQGIGSRLLRHLCQDATRPILIGTWAAADWAIRFYERHGFARVEESSVAPLLTAYWNVPERQIATSVVLSSPPLSHDGAGRLIAVRRRKGRDSAWESDDPHASKGVASMMIECRSALQPDRPAIIRTKTPVSPHRFQRLLSVL